MKSDKDKKLILISEMILQNIIDLTANFIDLLNELFADPVPSEKCKKERAVIENGFKKNIRLSDEWIKNFIEQNKAGRVCNNYGAALRGKDILKDYSRPLQNAYKAGRMNNFAEYRSSTYEKPKLYKSLQNIKQLQENILRLPRVFGDYERSRGVANYYDSSLSNQKNLYFNVHNDGLCNKAGDLNKFLDAYFNN